MKAAYRKDPRNRDDLTPDYVLSPIDKKYCDIIDQLLIDSIEALSKESTAHDSEMNDRVASSDLLDSTIDNDDDYLQNSRRNSVDVSMIKSTSSSGSSNLTAVAQYENTSSTLQFAQSPSLSRLSSSSKDTSVAPGQSFEETVAFGAHLW